jgi:hypothetical protein
LESLFWLAWQLKYISEKNTPKIHFHYSNFKVQNNRRLGSLTITPNFLSKVKTNKVSERMKATLRLVGIITWAIGMTIIIYNILS